MEVCLRMVKEKIGDISRNSRKKRKKIYEKCFRISKFLQTFVSILAIKLSYLPSSCFIALALQYGSGCP